MRNEREKSWQAEKVNSFSLDVLIYQILDILRRRMGFEAGW